MKILYAGTTPMPSFKASSIQTMGTANGLAAADVHVVVLAGRDPSQAAEAWAAEVAQHYSLHEGARVASFARAPGRLAFHGRYLSAFLRLTKVERFDLVYTRSGLLAMLGLMRGMPVLLEVHDLPRRRVVARVVGALTHRHRLFLGSPSRSLLRYWRRFLGAEPRMLRHIPHGTRDLTVPADVDHASAMPVERANGLAIGYVGSGRKGKGFELVVRIAEELPGERFTAVVSGAGSPSLRTPPNLTLYRDVAPPRVAAFYRSVDLLLLPIEKHTARGEHLPHERQMVPLRAVEYLGAGVPIIASDLWPVKEALQPTGAAIFRRPDDVPGWKEAILSVAHDAALRERLGRNAARAASEMYSWSSRAEAVKAIVRGDGRGGAADA